MNKPSVLISGAGIAGPALAYWLHRSGIAATVVEAAPRLRRGGQAVDFRGPVHRAVLEKMKLWGAIHERQTHSRSHRMLDSKGGPCAELPALALSGDVEILRGDLSELLYERTRDFTEYLFGDAIAGLQETRTGVDVTFESGRTRTFGLVVGADGLHSRVRSLAFGDDASVLRHHGYQIAGFSMPNLLGLDREGVTYSVTARSASIASYNDSREARVLLCFRAPPMARGMTRQAHLDAVTTAFAGVGWEVPRILAAMREATDVYFDDIATVRLDRYSHGRIVLLGDAGYGGTLGGQGTPLAIIGAYVLAGEIAKAQGDHDAAFAQYEARLRPYATLGQSGAKHVGAFHAPPSWLALQFRNFYLRVFATKLFAGLFARIVNSRSVDFVLPEYAWPPVPADAARLMAIPA